MTTPAAVPLDTVLTRIRDAERRHGRVPGSVALLAVSKQQSPEAIAALAASGQRAFGENYLQEALPKIAHLEGLGLSWHFIGRIQSNKTRDIAAHFTWVHTLDRPKIAQRLDAQRPPGLPPLECLVEVNVSGEASKGGVDPAALPELLACCRELPRLRLRGLMALPAPEDDFARQRAGFRRVREALAALGDPTLDTLSMGTSDDFEAAIAEGATIVRIGTALFGARPRGVG
jgi:hypothetical protein